MKNKLKELNVKLQKSKIARKHSNLRTTVLCAIDELNQYLNGNVSDSSVIEIIETLKKEIRNGDTILYEGEKVRIIDKYLIILALETLRKQCQNAEDQENVKRINKELNKIK